MEDFKTKNKLFKKLLDSKEGRKALSDVVLDYVYKRKGYQLDMPFKNKLDLGIKKWEK